MNEQITKVCNCNLEIFPSKILLQVMRLLEILLKVKLWVSNVLISSNDWLMCFPNKNSKLLFLEITNKLDKKNSHDLDQEIIKGMFYVRNRT